MLRDLFQRYRQSLLLTLALVLPLASMYWHGKTRAESTFVERGLLFVTSPFTQLNHDAIEAVRRWGARYVFLTNVELRAEVLERENKVLLGEALKSRAIGEELQRVKELCEFKAEHRDFTTVPARVIGRDVSQFFQVMRIKIDTDGLTGIQEGMAVITDDGVVGRIDRVAQGFADVMLVTDARSQVHATVPGKGVIGSVKGNGKRNEFTAQFVHLDKVERGAALSVGDAVLTTGHDRVFPAGLEIGHIADAAPKQSGPYQEFTLAAAVSYATLEEVLIVTGYKGPDADSPAPAAAPAAPAPATAPAEAKPRHAVDPANTPDSPP